jgi:hypothetical protein
MGPFLLQMLEPCELEMCQAASMVKTLEQAIEQISRLPDADQEQIGRKLLSHVEKLNALRAEIDKGVRSLDAGKGSALDIEDFLRRKNSGHGGA